jgi:hypothetical protein
MSSEVQRKVYIYKVDERLLESSHTFACMKGEDTRLVNPRFLLA